MIAAGFSFLPWGVAGVLLAFLLAALLANLFVSFAIPEDSSELEASLAAASLRNQNSMYTTAADTNIFTAE